MKDNYKLLNNVEIDLDKYKDLDINNKEKLKENLRFKINESKKSNKGLLAVASAGIISISMIGSGIINPSLANSIPAVQKIFIDLNKKLNLGYDSIEGMQDIKLSSTVNDITINIEETVSDGNSLYITYTINSKVKPLTDKANNTNYEMITEVEASDDIGLAGESTTELENGEVQGGNHHGYYKDEYTFVGIKKYGMLSDKAIPDEFTVNMKINELYCANKENSNIEGPWEFDFKVKKSVDSKRINLEQSQGEYKINYIDVTPFTMKLNLEFPESFVSVGNNELKRIEIEDDKGQQIFRTNYKKGEVERNIASVESTKLEKGIITTDITLNLEKYIGYKKPKYVLVKFVDYKNIIEDGKVTGHEKNKGTKDIEFKVDVVN